MPQGQGIGTDTVELQETSMGTKIRALVRWGGKEYRIFSRLDWTYDWKYYAKENQNSKKYLYRESTMQKDAHAWRL